MLILASPEEFLDRLLSCFYDDLRVLHKDNYDWARFSSDGVDRSNRPYTHLHKAMLLVVTRQTEALFKAYSLLQDETSRKLFWELIRYKLAGHTHVRLSRNDETYHAIIEKVLAYPSADPDPALNMGGPSALRRYILEWEGQSLTLSGFNLTWPFFLRQYYYERDGLRIQPERGDHVIDAGAGIGDASLAFAASVGPSGCIYTFEMLDVHLRVCEDNFKNNASLSRFKLFNKGLSDHIKAASVAGEDQKNPKFNFGFELKDDDPRFDVTTLDALVECGEIERVDFIKMDIEGSELRALKGAEKTLRRFRPKLAISLYHKVEDFYEIPLYLEGLGLGYRFYIDHYTIHAGETVLYAKTG